MYLYMNEIPMCLFMYKMAESSEILLDCILGRNKVIRLESYSLNFY